MKISGIYQIQSKRKPQRCYVGSAVYIRQRWANHLKQLRKNKHENGRLQNHFNKYGEGDLCFKILLGCDVADLINHEQYFIDSLKPWFNICKIAGSTLGTKRSPELCKRQGEIYRGENHPMFGRRHTKESIKMMSEHRKGHIPWNKGKKGVYSEETSKKMSEGQRRRKPPTPETRKKMSLSRSGHNNGMYGKKHSEESNRKNRESQIANYKKKLEYINSLL